MYYGYGMGYYGSMIILLPAIIFTMIVQQRINAAYNRYSQVRNSMGITGAEAARRILDQNGLTNVPVNRIGGRTQALTNYFDPKTNTVNLSPEIFADDSIASVGIACHEVGHAIQYARGYAPIRFRNAIVPVVNLTSTLSWPMILFGLMLSAYNSAGSILFNIGVICFLFVVLFHAVTLPVEMNASSRALQEMQAAGIFDAGDLAGSKKVLNAAAMTYVAALATAVASLLRILMIRGRR